MISAKLSLTPQVQLTCSSVALASSSLQSSDEAVIVLSTEVQTNSRADTVLGCRLLLARTCSVDL